MMQVCFVNTDQLPLETKHVCFYTKSSDDEIQLMEVYEETYPHPDAPNEGIVKLTTTRCVRSYKRTEFRAATTILLEASQKACANLPKQG
jgi:hypothetical protein